MPPRDACMKCLTQPKSILELACKHKLCLACASQQTEVSLDEEQIIVCDGCREVTYLDADVLRQLEGEASCQREKREKSKDLRQTDDNCRVHIEYGLMYVCKTCKDLLICPECAIHGTHYGHQVNSLHKEAQCIKAQLANQCADIKDHITKLQLLGQERIDSVLARRSEVEQLQVSAAKRYNQIRAHVDEEERTVLSKCQQLLQIYRTQEERTRRELQNQTNAFRSRMSQIQRLLSVDRSDSRTQSMRLIEGYKDYMTDSKNYFDLTCPLLNKPVLYEEDHADIRELSNRIEQIDIDKLQQSCTASKQRRGSGTVQARRKTGQASLVSTPPAQLRKKKNKSKYFQLL